MFLVGAVAEEAFVRKDRSNLTVEIDFTNLCANQLDNKQWDKAKGLHGLKTSACRKDRLLPRDNHFRLGVCIERIPAELSLRLSQNLSNDTTLDVGQTEVATTIAVGQLFVV